MKNKINDEENMDMILKKALASNMEPDEELNRKIIRKWKESSDMQKNKKRRFKLAVTGAMCVLLMSVTVGATVRYLKSSEVAAQAGADSIKEAFEGEGAIEINESKEAGGFRFTLMGIASGQAMIQSALSESMPELGSTYATIAIEKLDGTPMPSAGEDAYGENKFFISPLIQGLKPWQYNIASMNGGYNDIFVDGIQYRIIECNEIEKFADKKLYICISDSYFYDVNAFNYDEVSGEISENDSYSGVNLLYQLPIDTSRADSAAAEEYLRNLEDSWENDELDEMDHSSSNTEDAVDMEGNTDIEGTAAKKMALLLGGEVEEALKGMTKDESPAITVTLKDGVYEYNIKGEDGEVESTLYFYKNEFINGKGHMFTYSDYDEATGDPKLLIAYILTENGDGTATVEVYEMKF